MYSLIISANGEDHVSVSTSKIRLEEQALQFMNEELKAIIDAGLWTNFGALEIERVLSECLKIGDVEGAMELFATISEARGNICYIRIVPAEMSWDA